MQLRSLRFLLISFFAALALSVQAQTPPDATTLPRPPTPTPALGAVEIERIDAPGTAVVQDQQGFMWFVGNGLFRYDGYGYTHYQHDPQDTTSISVNRLESLFVDRSGTVWVGTFGGGLNRYDEETDTFTRFSHNPDDPTSLSQDTVTVILEDRQGTLWVGTHGGLNRFDPETGSFTHYRHDPADPASLSNDQVRALYEDRQGTLWVGTGSPEPTETPVGEGGLNRFDPVTGKFTRYLHDSRDETSLIHNQVMALYEDSRGTFYVGTLGDGLHTMDREAGTFTRHRYDPNDPTKLSRPFLEGATGSLEGCTSWGCGGVSFIHEDQNGMLWIGGYLGGINRYDLETGAMTHHETATSGLAFESIWNMTESHDGTLWVGTWGGAHKMIASANTFPHIAPDPADPNSLGGPGVRAIHEDRDGTLWISAWPQGLDRYDRATGRFTHYRNDPDDPASLGSNSVYSFHEDRAGVLWIGANRAGGLNRYDPTTDSFTHYRNDPNDPTSLGIASILAIQEDRQGRLWVGTSNSGLNRLDRATDAFIRYQHDPDDLHSLSDNFVRVLYEDDNGTLWAGTINGLSRFDTQTETPGSGLGQAFTTYLQGSVVSEIYQDQEGRFWVGTWGDGLHLFNRETGESIRYNREDGLPLDNVASVVEDDHGALWISTAEGSVFGPISGRLSRFDPETQTFTNYDRQDGLPEIGFSWDSALKSRDGTLFFGGNGGFTAFDPATIRHNVGGPPKMGLTGLRIFNEEAVPGAEAPIKRPVQMAEEIRLSSDQNDFTLDYTGLSFRDPEGLRYQYRLENHDVGWVSAQAQRSARYTGLDPGEYVFQVRATDSKGLRSVEEASIRVVILPPWWRTVWAYLLYGLVFIGGVFAIDRVQRRRLLKKERERTAIEQARFRAEAAELQTRALQAENERNTLELEKARELEKAYNQLQTTQAQLVQSEKMASLGQLTAGIAHEIKNPLNFVNNFAELNEELARELSQMVAENSDRRIADVREDLNDLVTGLKLNANQITKHGKRADRIVESMMKHASADTKERFRVEVNAFVEEYTNLAYQAKMTQVPDLAEVQIKRDYDETVGSVEMTPQEMSRVLLNLLGNAFDAVHEKMDTERDYVPTVIVTTRRIADGVEIRVNDNGPGIPIELKEKIYEPFFTTKPTGQGSTGLGLSLSYDIVTQGHGGTLAVESTEGEGATFIISLPNRL